MIPRGKNMSGGNRSPQSAPAPVLMPIIALTLLLLFPYSARGLEMKGENRDRNERTPCAAGVKRFNDTTRKRTLATESPPHTTDWALTAGSSGPRVSSRVYYPHSFAGQRHQGTGSPDFTIQGTVLLDFSSTPQKDEKDDR